MKVVAVKFKTGGKVYYFAPKAGETYVRNAPVIVETTKGQDSVQVYAWVAQPEQDVSEKDVVAPLKPIVRLATEEDKKFYEECEKKKPQAMRTCKEKIAELGLEMKLIDCEYTFDGNKIIFYFTSPNRVDFRELVKSLGATFHTRIELRQIWEREETKYLGGIAPCGRVCCCHGNMPECHVSIKMAKTQGLSLNPAKISGLCGKLMCCLAYESEYYMDAYKKVPKIGAEVSTLEGKGKVVSVNMLKMEVKVKIEDGQGGLSFKDFRVEDVHFKRNAPEKEDKNDNSDFLPQS